jgi:hypothetical protein
VTFSFGDYALDAERRKLRRGPTPTRKGQIGNGRSE